MSLRKLKRQKKKKSVIRSHRSADIPRPPKLSPHAIEQELNRAAGHLGTGNLQAAQEICEKVLAVSPDNDNALHMLGVVAMQTNNYEGAAQLFERAVNLDPRYHGYCNNLGLALEKLQKREEAVAYYQKAVQLKPDYAEAYFNLGNALTALGRDTEALQYFQKAFQLKPDNAEICFCTGNLLSKAGNNTKAMDYFQRTVQIKPDHTDAYCAIAWIYQTLGKIENSNDYYKKALQYDKNCAMAFHNLVKNKAGRPTDQENIAWGKEMLQGAGLNDDQRSDIYFTLGGLYEKCGLYDQAFENFQQGNLLAHKRLSLDIDETSKHYDRIITAFSDPSFIQERLSENNSETPVFIIGMPRSGTSLVEQIIASHPAVHGAGELNILGEIVEDFKRASNAVFPELLTSLTAQQLMKMSLDYETSTRGGAPTEVERISDKMPYNFMYLGLINILFPKARIIHCRRNPMDTCLSIYFQKFAEGNNYAYDLKELGTYYRQYLKLMKHWRSVLHMKMLEISYEDIVANLEGKSRELIGFLGLDWNEACLSFHKTQRQVRTASVLQVRQPIYASSVQRWKRYEEFLGPLKESLEELRNDDRQPG